MGKLAEARTQQPPALLTREAPVRALTLGFVGSGRAASALARSFRRAGHRLLIADRGEGSARRAERVGASPLPVAAMVDASDVVILAVPDRVIAPLAEELAVA